MKVGDRVIILSEYTDKGIEVLGTIVKKYVWGNTWVEKETAWYVKRDGEDDTAPHLVFLEKCFKLARIDNWRDEFK